MPSPHFWDRSCSFSPEISLHRSLYLTRPYFCACSSQFAGCHLCTVCSSMCCLTATWNQTWWSWALWMVGCFPGEMGFVWENSLEVSFSGSLGLYRHTDYINTLTLTFLQSHSCSIFLIIFFFKTDEMNSLAGCKHLLNSADGATSECLQVNWWNRGTAFIFMSIGNEKYMVKIYGLLKMTALPTLRQRACPGFDAKNW